MKAYKFELFTSTIEKNIRTGIFKPGHKLPSVRELKEEYRLSISTIQHGYEYLMIQGLVESVPKSGYYVCYRPESFKKELKSNLIPTVRDAIFSNHLQLTTSLRSDRKFSEFNVAAPGDLLIPQKLVLRTMQQVVREQGAGLLRYYPSNGSLELKENIIKRAAAHRSVIHIDELLVTDGALQAFYIALASTCMAGDIVAVESPCVFSILEVIRVLNLKVIEVPIDPDIGFDIDFFRNACHHNKIKAAILTPNFHNPTGILMSDEHKLALVTIAYQYHIALIENDIYGDLNFHGTRPTTLRSFDETGLVLTYSSYAKTLAPGIRLGWLAAGKFMERAEQIKFSLGSTVSPIYQETVNKLLTGSSYDRHIRAFKAQLAKNAYFTVNLISDNFPQKTAVLIPSGGYNIWVKMPDHIDMDYFYKKCEQIGVRFTPGFTFSFSGAFDHYFRVVFADKFSDRKIEGIKLAGQLFK